MAGASFGGPLLLCLLNLTFNKKSLSHILQFALKYHVFLNSLQAQIWDHINCSSGLAATYHTAVGLEKKKQRTDRQTDREQRTFKAVTEATLIVDGLSG